ncbi:hypothetical protein GXW84_34125 [Rhodococcus sp. IEGM 248]|nr:hypothetical protein [Rhodococcus sp. IEGM 248]
MSGNHDPLKDWLVATWRDIFGDSGDGRGNQVREDGQPTRIRRFTSLSPIAVVAAGVALYSPRLMSAAAGNETVVGVLTKLHGYRVLLVAAAALTLVIVDVLRHRMHKWSQMLESVVRQGTGHLPKTIAVPFPPGWRVIRRAAITLHRGTVIRPKQFEEVSRAIAAAFSGSDKWEVKVRHEAHHDRIIIARKTITPDTRSDRQKVLQSALDDASIFKDPKVTALTVDEAGIETGYRIAFEKSMNAGANGFQLKVDEALASLAGQHESGRMYWVDPPAEYQNIEYQPLPNYDYDTNAYVEPENYYLAPVQLDQLHLPTPVEPTAPFIAPRDSLRLGELHIKQPNWISDLDRDRTNNTMSVVQAGVSTGWRSIGVETSRADRIAAAQVGAGAAGAALGAVTAGGAAATAGALVGGTIGGLTGMTAGNVFLPGLGWVPAGIVGTAAGAGLGAAVGIPVAAAGAVVGGAAAVAAVTPIAAGDKGEPREIEVPDIDSEAVTAQTETVLTDWENSGPVGQAAADAVQDTVEAAPAIDQQARDFVAAQPCDEQIIEQVDTTLNSFFTDATPGLAGNLLSGAIGGGIPAAN